MKVHHLNCTTFCPLGGRLLNPHGKWVCHCLLIESHSGLILIDTGFGMKDIQNPKMALPPWVKFCSRPQLSPETTALKQIEKLGYKNSDVRHILLTHLDPDHAGGISDFPQAEIHVFSAEYFAAFAPSTSIERLRYRTIHWQHHPKWITHQLEGESWHGFQAVKSLQGLPPEILMVPLPGHTWGHAGFAIDTGAGWLFHAGDAYFDNKEIDVKKPRSPLGLRLLQSLIEVDHDSRIHNQKRLRDLRKNHPEDVTIFCSHDPSELLSLSV